MHSPILLYIDDRAELLKLRKTTLESTGYSVEVATSPRTAVQALQGRLIAAVLIEYTSEAEAVARHIKEHFPDHPIILLSAYSELPERVLWLVDEYVMRSEPLEGLAQVIERVTRPAQSLKPAV